MRLAFLLALVCSAASAQPSLRQRFAPLHVGDVWEYRHTDYAPNPVVPLGHLVSSVVADTVLGGTAYFVLTEQTYNPQGEATGPLYHTLYNYTAGVAPATSELPDYRGWNIAIMDQLIRTSYATGVPIDIGGQTVVVDSTLNSLAGGCCGSGGSYTYVSDVYALNIGRTSQGVSGRRHAAACPQNPADCNFSSGYMLTYARVGGNVYGAPVVADEPSAPATAAFALTASPNPFSSDVAVTAAGVAGPVTVAVFDALGRRVGGGVLESGTSFLFRPAAAGVYVIRAQDAAGQVATRRVVRR
jgi:hypothetical protein